MTEPSLSSPQPNNFLQDSVVPMLGQSPITVSSLTELYDGLLNVLENEEQHEKNPLLPPHKQDDWVVHQADYLRALQLTCQLILGVLNHSSANATQQQQQQQHQLEVLQQTLQRSQLLLQVLQVNHADNPLLLESNYEILQQAGQPVKMVPHKEQPGLYNVRYGNDNDDSSSDDDDDDDDGGNLLCGLDRQSLEQEEANLIRMANTPIPSTARMTFVGEAEPTCRQLDDISTTPKISGDDLQLALQQEWTLPVYQKCQEQK